MKRVAVYLSIILISCTNAPAPMRPVVKAKTDSAAIKEAYTRFLKDHISIASKNQ